MLCSLYRGGVLLELLLVDMNVNRLRYLLRLLKKIADAFEVSLDYLVGQGQNASFDKKTLQRIQDLELLEENKKKTLFDLIDTYIRDAKTRQAYAG